MGRESKLRSEREALFRRHRVAPLAELRPDGELYALHLELLTIVVRALDRARDLGGALAAVQAWWRSFDAHAAARPVERDFPAPAGGEPGRRVHLRLACAPGCAWCCTLRVTCTAAEALALAAHLREVLDPAAMAALRERMDAHEAACAALEPRARINTPRMCPLNVDGRCVAYEARPIGCRKYHSFDVAICRSAVEGGSFSGLRVPADPRRFDTQDVFRRTLARAFAAFGIPTTELELVPALRLALDRADPAAPIDDASFAAAHSPALIDAVRDEHARARGGG